MYVVNKIVGYLVSPMGFALALAAAALLARTLGRRKAAGWALALAFANLWLWSTPLMSRWTGRALEEEFLDGGRVPSVESLPRADAIVLHGGAMGVATNLGYAAEMWTGADRVWHAARLWKAGKAPKVVVTGVGADLSTAPLLADLGVPAESVVCDVGPRNTEEEVKAIVRSLDRSDCPRAGAQGDGRKVLVVTSAWHMRRTLLTYGKYAQGVQAVPAPCDFENALGWEKTRWWEVLLPNPWSFMMNSTGFHEWVGYWGYRLLR